MPFTPKPAPTPAPTAPSSLHSYKGWSFDPALIAGGTLVPAAGTLYLTKLQAPGSISTVETNVVTAGVTLANVGFALYSVAGALLTSSVNANGATAAAFQAVGAKAVTFTARSITDALYVGFWFTGTTLPTLARGSTTAPVNMLLAAPNFRFSSANTGLTTTAPATLGTQTAVNVAWWMGAS